MDNSEITQDGGNRTTVDWKKNGIPNFDWVTPPHVHFANGIIDDYQKDGVVLIREMFKDWVEPLRKGLDRNLTNPDQYAFPCDSNPTGAPGRFFDSYCNWLLIPEYFEHITESSAASFAGQLMKSSTAQFFHEHAFCKDPGTQCATPWHQDMPYYCVDGTQTVSLYIALDETPAEVAVSFVRGSHRWGKLYHPVAFLDAEDFESEGVQLEEAPDINECPDEYDVASWDLEPGDCIAFDFRTLHGTTAGEVKAKRRAVSTRWLGDDITYYERKIKSSPPYPDIGLESGDRMRTDWFPILWRAS